MTREEIAGCLEAACKLCDAAYDAWKADQRSEQLWADYTSAQRTASDVLRVYQNAIFAALRADSDAAVERAGGEILLGIREIITRARNEDLEQACRDVARAALRAALEPQPDAPMKPASDVPQWMKVIPLDTKPGTKIRFMNLHGHAFEREYAASVLSTEADYTLERINVGDWSSTVVLAEHPAHKWNSVMFCLAGAP